MISILDNWKKNQDSAKPLLVLLNTSGGGHRSATFTMSMLQHLDSITQGSYHEKDIPDQWCFGRNDWRHLFPGIISAAAKRKSY